MGPSGSTNYRLYTTDNVIGSIETLRTVARNVVWREEGDSSD